MALTLSKSFTATGVGGALSVSHGNLVEYTISNTFVGTVLFEKSFTAGQSWEVVFSKTGTATGSVLIEHPAQGMTLVRFRCSAFTSGQIDTSIVEPQPAAVVLETTGGDPAITINEDATVEIPNLTGATALAGDLTQTGAFVSSGAAGIGGIASASAVLNLGTSNPLSGATQIGVQLGSAFVASSACTTNAYGTSVKVGVANASFTLPILANYHSSAVAKGASATVTRAVGFYQGTAMTTYGAANSAIFADNASFSGDFAFNVSSTKPSVHSGALGVGGANDATGVLYLGNAANPISTSVSQYAAVAALVGSSTATAIQGYRSSVTTAAASFTASNLIHFRAVDTAKGSGSAITRNIGLGIDMPTQGTNNAILSDNVSSFTGSWGLYLSTANANYVGGPLRIATTAAVMLTNEMLTIQKVFGAGSEGQSIGGIVSNIYQDADAAWTVNSSAAVTARLYRRISASQTDTNSLNAALATYTRFNIAVGQTLTNAQANAWNGIVVNPPLNDAAGTLAITNYAGINIVASSLATGTNKYGLYCAAQSGASTNFGVYVVANNNYFGGYVGVASQADPGAVVDGIRIGSQDSADSTSTLSLRTEQVVAAESLTPDATLKIFVNGTAYKLLLKS